MGDSTITLGDGRTLSFAESGDPAGTPLFFFHGLPGSRSQGQLLGDVTARGVRLITPERPGFGESTLDPQRTVSGYTADVAALADHLGMDRFLVSGASGGGPYALACAALLGDRVIGAASLSGAGDMTVEGAWDGMHAGNVAILTLARDTPYEEAAAVMAAQLADAPEHSSDADPEDAPDPLAELPADDRRIMEEHPDVVQILALGGPEALAHGPLGLAYEGWLALQPWDVDPSTIAVPVRFWHGDADANVPVGQARRLAGLIPGATLTEVPGAGHLFFVEHLDEIFDWLLSLP